MGSERVHGTWLLSRASRNGAEARGRARGRLVSCPLLRAIRGRVGDDAYGAGPSVNDDDGGGNVDGFVVHSRLQECVDRNLMFDTQENRRLRDNQRQCARIQRKVAGDNGRFVPRFLKEDVSSLRKRSFEDSSNEAYSVADCDQERTAELAASDHPPGERIPRGVLPRQLMETRQRARVAEDEDRSRHREAKLQDMISRQMDDVGSILAERHGTAIAGDCVCEGRDREADDRAAGRREQDTRISSRGGEPIWCPPVVGAAEGLEGPSVGREQAHEDDEYIDGARSTRLLLNRAHATLARALTLEDGEHDGIDQEGDLAFRGRLPPPAGGPGCVEGPLRQESRGGWEGRQPSGPHEPPTFFTTNSPNTRGQEKSQRERKNSGKGYRQKRARRRCPHVHVRARGWNNRQSED